MEPQAVDRGIRPDGMNLSAPDAPLKLYNLLKENTLAGKDINAGKFLDDLSDLDSLGVIDGQRQLPGLAERIKSAGSDPLLWLETYQRTKNSVDTNDLPDIQKDLRLAHLLGMDQLNPDDDPRKQAAIRAIQGWREKYKTQQTEPPSPPETTNQNLNVGVNALELPPRPLSERERRNVDSVRQGVMLAAKLGTARSELMEFLHRNLTTEEELSLLQRVAGNRAQALEQFVRNQLKAHGYVGYSDLQEAAEANLIKELALPPEESFELANKAYQEISYDAPKTPEELWYLGGISGISPGEAPGYNLYHLVINLDQRPTNPEQLEKTRILFASLSDEAKEAFSNYEGVVQKWLVDKSSVGLSEGGKVFETAIKRSLGINPEEEQAMTAAYYKAHAEYTEGIKGSYTTPEAYLEGFRKRARTDTAKSTLSVINLRLAGRVLADAAAKAGLKFQRGSRGIELIPI